MSKNRQLLDTTDTTIPKKNTIYQYGFQAHFSGAMDVQQGGLTLYYKDYVNSDPKNLKQEKADMLYPIELKSGEKTKIEFIRNEPSRLTAGVTFFLQAKPVPAQKTMDGEATLDPLTDSIIPFSF